ncbi:MAG: DUF1080 domain-containing protein [Gemmatimonadota bacterium]|nr:DUF1080 domain-containing protein [Gemmatimonadota bacterium]
MRPNAAFALSTLGAAALALALPATVQAQPATEWPVHSMSRPQPRVVDPGPFTASLPPPSDAIVLFDGRSLAAWRSAGTAGGPSRWRIGSDYMEVVPGAGGIATVQEFGDVQLHLEWMAPSPPAGDGQSRGNSGVFLMGRYELQILDSYRSVTYSDGQAAALYGQEPPLVNASRPPGQWQTYDIIFRRPRFDAAGKLQRAARITVLHNGVLVHDAATIGGATRHQERATYSAHPDRLSLSLQDHGHPVRFRNIWVRELPESER